MSTPAKAQRDVCQEITNQIVTALEKGVAPWRAPMDQAGAVALPENAATLVSYNGVNTVNLWAVAHIDGYASNRWLTFQQALAAGGCVRKGEKGTVGIFYKTLEKESGSIDEATGAALKDHIPMLRSFTLFNLDQIDGVEHLREQVERQRYPFTAVEAGERLMRAAGVAVQEGGAQAFYRPSTDAITLPDRDRFEWAEDFYAVYAHELTHATKHPSRCGRKPYETQILRGAYAFEELVAELGCLFTVAHVGLPQPVTNHASYIADWLEVLKNDKRCIFKAAALAQRACDWSLAALATYQESRAA